MSTHLEDELRATLHRRAARVPPDAVARITAHPYHPRTRRLRRPAAFGVTGAALAGGAGAAIALLGGAAPAFAGWTANPTAPAPGQLAAAAANCQAHLPIQGLPLQLSDTRGPFTFQVYATDQSSTICITGPSFTSVAGAMSSQPVSVPADQLDLAADHATSRGGSSYSFADGRAGSGVTGATLHLDDGTQVQATVENGWFVAWWPGTTDVSSATLTTADGTQTQTFRAPGSPCSPKMCTGAHPASAYNITGYGGATGGHASGSASSFGEAVGGAGGPGTSTGTSTTGS